MRYDVLCEFLNETVDVGIPGVGPGELRLAPITALNVDGADENGETIESAFYIEYVRVTDEGTPNEMTVTQRRYFDCTAVQVVTVTTTEGGK